MPVSSNITKIKSALPMVATEVNANLRGYARASALRVQENAKGLLGTMGPATPRWPNVKEDTTLALRQENDGPGALLDTGALRDSIVAQVGLDEEAFGDLDIVYYIGPQEGSTGTRANGSTYRVDDAAFLMEYGGTIHDTGTPFDGKKVPARPFLRPALMMERANLAKNARGAIRAGLDKAIGDTL